LLAGNLILIELVALENLGSFLDWRFCFFSVASTHDCMAWNRAGMQALKMLTSI
jgi:hypothetical protein